MTEYSTVLLPKLTVLLDNMQGELFIFLKYCKMCNRETNVEYETLKYLYFVNHLVGLFTY